VALREYLPGKAKSKPLLLSSEERLITLFVSAKSLDACPSLTSSIDWRTTYARRDCDCQMLSLREPRYALGARAAAAA
jgi:hypothetical protein